MTDEPDNELLEFFKALAEPSRLKIVGLLARQPCTVEQLAAMLNLRASTVSNHLGYLKHVGLVSARAEGYYSVYQLEEKALQEKAKRLISPHELSKAASSVDLEAFDRKVIASFSKPDGSLKEIPAQHRKLEVILRYVVQAFEPDRRYNEKQVNELLGHFHEDTATLRRELVCSHLMERQADGEAYWRVKDQAGVLA
jgi:predicted transcriptional regulator